MTAKFRTHCRWIFALALFALGSTAFGDDFAALCADRTAIEHVYYNHRLGDKPPFEKVSPPALIQRLVREDLTKEAVLKKVYGVVVTRAMLNAELARIDATTRAPDMLAELKASLHNDTNRFALALAKPIVVERLLRNCFENDDQLHAAGRREMEQVRAQLLAARANGGPATNLLPLLKQAHSNDVSETTWQFGAPPAESAAASADEIEIKKRYGANAQLLSAPSPANSERKLYFEDLPPQLGQVLEVQLRQAGDVSAVIEMPAGFALYLCTARTAETLSAAALTLAKRNFEDWLAEQGKGLE